MPHDNFIVAGVDTQTHDDGVHIRLNFLDATGEVRSVVMRRQDMPILLSALHQETTAGSVVPIRPQGLQIGADYKLEGYQVRKLPGGGAQLTLAIELMGEGRTVTLNLSLSPLQLADLVKHLS